MGSSLKKIPEMEGVTITVLDECPQCNWGEAPIWHPVFNAFYYIDVFGKKLMKWDPKERRSEIVLSGELFTSLAPTQTGLIAPTETEFIHLELPSLKRTTLDVEWPHSMKKMKFNDAKVTPEGKFVIGSMDARFWVTSGVMGLVNFDGSVNQLADKIQTFNGPTWNSQSTKVYWSDALKGKLFTADWNGEKGEIEGQRLFAQCPSGYPDGANTDVHDFLYSCTFSSGCILKYNPEGEIVAKISLPTKYVTSCYWGGDDLKTLFVTSCSRPTKITPYKKPNGVPLAITFADDTIRGNPLPLCKIKGLQEELTSALVLFLRLILQALRKI